jgi:hypothetical protein
MVSALLIVAREAFAIASVCGWHHLEAWLDAVVDYNVDDRRRSGNCEGVAAEDKRIS